MNKGFIKIGLLLTGVMALAGIVGYLVSATNVEAVRAVTICHVPPGNPANAQTLELDENGLNGHKDNRGDLHGLDYYGECGGENEPEEFDRPYVTVRQACGKVQLTFHNPTPWLFVFDYRIDNEPKVDDSPYFGTPRWHLVPLTGNHTEDRLFEFDEDSGTHLVEWRLAEGAEQDYYFDWQSTEVESDCEVNTILVCLDGEQEKEVPDTEETRARLDNAFPNWYEGECEEPEPEPEPSPTPTEEPRTTTEASAPVCPDGVLALVPQNPHVVRNGGDATVNAHIPEGNIVNVYFRENDAEGWQHAARDIQVEGGYVSYTIHDLDPALGYTFGIQAANGCAGGETVLAVIIDPPANGALFPFSYWEWMN